MERPPQNMPAPDAAQAWADGSPENAADLQAYLDSRPYLDQDDQGVHVYLDVGGAPQELAGGVAEYEHLTQQAREAELLAARLELPHRDMPVERLALEHAKGLHAEDPARQKHTEGLLGIKEAEEAAAQLEEATAKVEEAAVKLKELKDKGEDIRVKLPDPRELVDTSEFHERFDMHVAHGVKLLEKKHPKYPRLKKEVPLSAATWLRQNNTIQSRETTEVPGEKRSYPPSERDYVYTTSVLEGSGQKLVWHDHRETRRLGRQVLITTASGRQIFVRGDRAYDMEASEATGKPVFREMGSNAPPPSIEVGKSWLGSSEPVDRVEVLLSKSKVGKKRINLDEFPESDDFNELEDAAALLNDIGEPTKWDTRWDKSKEALGRAASRSKEVAKKGVDRFFETRNRGYKWTAEQAVQLGAFAVAMQAEAPEIVNRLGEADMWIDEAYGGKKKKLADNLARYALLHMVVLHETKQAARKTWKKRKSPAPYDWAREGVQFDETPNGKTDT